MKLVKGLLLKPTLNLLNLILKCRDGNSLILGGPLGWSWQATLDATHHGSLAGPANAHRHSDLANIGIDDHHARDHAIRHQLDGADQVSLDASQVGTGRFGMVRMPDGTSGYYLKAQGAGVDPAYAAAATVPSGLIAMWHGLIANIPTGWVICDGNNSTPNLLARFVEGVASAATNPGATGGALSKTTAGHTHTNPTTSGPSTTTGQPVGGSAFAGPTHTHTQGNTGSKTDSISDIRPPYYDVAFIMKT